MATENLLIRLARELRREQPRWGMIGLWLREHGWDPQDQYAVLVPEAFPLGSDRGKPDWVVPWCPVEHLTVQRSVFAYAQLPQSWTPVPAAVI